MKTNPMIECRKKGMKTPAEMKACMAKSGGKGGGKKKKVKAKKKK